MSTPIELKQQVNVALNVLISLGLVIITIIFLLELILLISEPRKFSPKSLQTRWRIPLILSSVFCLFLLGIDGAFEWQNWTDNPDGCGLMPGFITMIFVLEKQCINLFLYDRAKIVHMALDLNSWKMKALRWSLWVTILFGVHLFFGWSYFLNFYGLVSVDGDCIYYCRHPEVIIAFAVSDACLNIGMLLLFVIPLCTYMKPSSKGEKSAQVAKILKKNMGLSLAIISLDITCLGLMGSAFIITNEPKREEEYLVLWGNTAAVIDQMLIVILAHAMSGGWIPLIFQVLFYRVVKKMQFTLRKSVADDHTLTSNQT